jgi:hypothetical protein
MTYTTKQLEAALAKMLPEKIYIAPNGLLAWRQPPKKEHHYDDEQYNVDETSLLQICWWIEERLLGFKPECYLIQLKASGVDAWHATWQQRTVELAKVKGVEIA